MWPLLCTGTRAHGLCMYEWSAWHHGTLCGALSSPSPSPSYSVSSVIIELFRIYFRLLLLLRTHSLPQLTQYYFFFVLFLSSFPRSVELYVCIASDVCRSVLVQIYFKSTHAHTHSPIQTHAHNNGTQQPCAADHCLFDFFKLLPLLFRSYCAFRCILLCSRHTVCFFTRSSIARIGFSFGFGFFFRSSFIRIDRIVGCFAFNSILYATLDVLDDDETQTVHSYFVSFCYYFFFQRRHSFGLLFILKKPRDTDWPQKVSKPNQKKKSKINTRSTHCVVEMNGEKWSFLCSKRVIGLKSIHNYVISCWLYIV